MNQQSLLEGRAPPGAARVWPRAGWIFLLLGIARGAADYPMTIHADLRDAPQGLLHAAMTIPVSAGPLTLLYPKWIPGEHGPRGPIENLSGIEISAAGRPIAWRRDLEVMYALHLDVPAGVSRIEVRVEYLGPANGAFGSGPTTTPKLAVLNWQLVTLYPQGAAASDILVEPSVTVPDGWGVGTSLAVESVAGATTQFKPLSLEMLIDQPVITGAHFRRFDLTPGQTPGHVIEAAADSADALALNDARTRAFARVPLEYAALMGIRHYETYHFLLALSDRFSPDGVEHHQASDNRSPERTLVDSELFPAFASLMTHEYFHSWNGKFRRPAGLLSPDYQKPMLADLLWVYEGLTEYYGDVMAARAGLFSADEYRENLAATAGRAEGQKGRAWRSLQDTADAAQFLYVAPPSWSARRRSVDFYDEGELIWLEADARIRTQTHGDRSLDDFSRAFFGDGGSGPVDPARVPGERPRVVPYQAGDVYAALNRVLPMDWQAFFAERLNSLRPHPPLEGIALAGSRVVYNEEPNPIIASLDKTLHQLDLTYSVGLVLDAEKNSIIDVIPGSAADLAGLVPGMNLVAVNKRKYTDELLKAAIASGKKGAPIEILAENATFFTTHRLSYGGGLVYPHLARTEGEPDLIGAIIAARVK
jgi:predicted metalloprotease with PDZ domain